MMDAARPTGDEPVTSRDERAAGKRHAASVLLCYAPDCQQDRALLDRLMDHLVLLHREGKIRAWHDRMLVPGDEREAEVRKHLDEAQVVLLLISASFVASDTCYERLAARAMERRAAGKARVIPVVLRPCEWRSAPFGALEALPPGGKAIAQFEDVDVAFTEVVKGLRAALESTVTAGATVTPAQTMEASSAAGTSKRRTTVVTLVVVALVGAGVVARALRDRGEDGAPSGPVLTMQASASGHAPPNTSDIAVSPPASVWLSESSTNGASPPRAPSTADTSNAAQGASVVGTNNTICKPQTTSAASRASSDATPSADVSTPSKAAPGASNGVRVGSVRTGNESPVAIGNGAKDVGVSKVETGDKSPVTIGNQ